MDEILSNPIIQWVFGGIGVFVLDRIINFFYKRKKEKNENSVVNQSQVTGNNSQATQIGNIHYGDK